VGITIADESNLTFYFLAASVCLRSTQGDMLDRALRMTRDSDGLKLVEGLQWNWLPNGEDSPMQEDPSHQVVETSYWFDPDKAERVGNIGRRIRKLQQDSPLHALVLEAYYGDRGCRWSHNATTRTSDAGKVVWQGSGPGTIGAVYEYTATGRKVLKVEAARMLSEQPDIQLNRDEMLESIIARHSSNPTRKTAARLAAIREEAESLLVESWSAWLRTEPSTKAKKRRAEMAVAS
jgi:hypothetical protein